MKPPAPRSRLVARLREEIERTGPLPFDRFMELALYDPEDGYYARHGAERLGPRGDFFTAADVGTGFGQAIARQLAEVDRLSGPFDPFDVVEFGAGRGGLGRDLLDALADDADRARRLRLTLVDRSPSMRAAAAATLPGARVVGPEAAPRGVTGAVLAVELFDALPVRRVRRERGELVELRVGIGPAGELLEIAGRPDPETAAWAERYGAATAEGSEAEVALGLAPALDALAATLERGLMLIVDYGDLAARLYGPARRRGTLVGYRDHTLRDDPLADPGRQDLTAHVNFSALTDRARELRLAELGFTTQDRFLIGNGLLEAFEQPDLAAAHDPRRVKRRLQALQLIHPLGMGRAFRVLGLWKGVAPPGPLGGFADPFAR